MNLREKIIKEAFNYNSPFAIQDYTLTKFLKGFKEDYHYFGENTADLYNALFLLEDTNLHALQENIEEVGSLLENNNQFFFKNVLIEDWKSDQKKAYDDAEAEGYFPNQFSGPKTIPGSTTERQKKALAAWANKPAGKPWGGVDKDGNPIYKQAEKLAVRKGNGATIDGFKSKEALKATLEQAADAKTPEEALKVLQSAQAPAATAAVASTAAKAAVAKTGAKTVAKAVQPTGVLGWIQKAFGNVKNFFTGGVSSISTALKNGNWTALMKVPLVQGALGVGGAVLAFKLLKKIFGKKIKPAQEAQLQAALNGARK